MLNLIQTQAVCMFPSRYSEDFGFPRPRGRGSEEEQPMHWLISTTKKTDVYIAFRGQWMDMINAICEITEQKAKPRVPLSESAFRKLWLNHYPFLKIAKGGSDYCDFCTSKRNFLSSLTGEQKGAITRY